MRRMICGVLAGILVAVFGAAACDDETKPSCDDQADRSVECDTWVYGDDQATAEYTLWLCDEYDSNLDCISSCDTGDDCDTFNECLSDCL